jgi:hypothetical protein
MGHQFGASHTFNGTTTSNCFNNRVPSTAFEPGTGSTIMAYRGTSGANAGYFPICGSAIVTIPNIASTTARIKVEAVGNIFFNISPGNFSIAAANPILLTEEGASTRAVVLESVTFRRDPFPFFNPLNLSVDQRNRIVLFAINLELAAGENHSAVTVKGEDSQHRVFQFPVEFVGKVPGFSWLTHVVVKLPDASSGAGDVMITIGLHGRVSNQAIIRIQ